MEINQKTIITAALTGSQGSKERNRNTPVTCDEIIEDAYQCYLEGAAIVHIHVKAEDGVSPVINYDKFKYIKDGIRNKCDVIINFTTSGEYNHVAGMELIGTADALQEKRLKIVDLEPDVATYDIPTMNFGERIFMNPLLFLRQLGTKMMEKAVKPEVEVYGLGDIALAEKLMGEGVLARDAFFQICLGISGGTPATVKNLVAMQDALPQGVSWSAFGVGANHLPILYATLALGGHVRVGLEDNLYYKKGVLTSNPELVARAARIIREFGNEVATPEDARKLLKINN